MIKAVVQRDYDAVLRWTRAQRVSASMIAIDCMFVAGYSQSTI